MAPRMFLAALLALMSVFVLSTATAADTEKKSNVIVLTSDSFEHLTQAATGATTGDWLVEFYAPWCGHCKRLEPVYEQIADELKGAVNVAKVDVTENKELGKRFEIKGFPTILFFRHGRIYKFSGARTVEEISRFARSGYKSLESRPVPGAPTPLTEITRHLTIIKDDFIALLATKKNVLLATFSGGLFVGVLLGWFCSCCTSRSPAPAKKTKTN